MFSDKGFNSFFNAEKGVLYTPALLVLVPNLYLFII